jgi:amidase
MSSLAKDTQWVDAVDQADLVSSGKVTPVELLDAAIERAEQLNPAINALTYTWYEKAREIARNLPANTAMPLRGVPFILKDLHAAMKGLPLSNGNKAMKAASLNSDYTAEIVQRFINAGLVIFGRGNSPIMFDCSRGNNSLSNSRSLVHKSCDLRATYPLLKHKSRGWR